MNKTFFTSSPLGIIASFSYEIFIQSCISTTRLPTYQIHWLSTRCSSWWRGIPQMWCMYHTGWMVCTLGLWLDNYYMFHWVYLFYEHTHTLPAYHHHGKCQHCLLKINQLRTLFNSSSVGSVVASWLVRSTLTTSSLAVSPGWGHCVVFLGKTCYSHGVSLHPGVSMGTGKLNAGG